MQNHINTPWPSILLLLLSSFSCLICFSTGALVGFTGLMEFASGNSEVVKSTLMLSMGSIFLGIILLPAVYYSFMRILNKPAMDLPLQRIPTTALIIVWIAAAGLGLLLEKQDSMLLLLLPLNVLTVVMPVWILARIAIRGLDVGSNECRWGTITVGMTIVPFLIGIAEIIAIAFIGIVAIIWIGVNPSILNAIEALSARLMYTNNPDALARILTPYLLNPAVIITCLIFFSVFTPLIEEAIKPLGVWLSPNQIMTPRLGFAIGALCGAGYALVESLGALSSSYSSWGLLSLARAGSDLLHIVTAGLMGWALVSAWRERKFLQLGLTYLVVILLHGIWNGLSLASATGIAVGYMTNPSPWLKSLPVISIIGLMILALLNFSILIRSNKILRETSPSQIQIDTTGEEPIAE
jgi:hypothetical protein